MYRGDLVVFLSSCSYHSLFRASSSLSTLSLSLSTLSFKMQSSHSFSIGLPVSIFFFAFSQVQHVLGFSQCYYPDGSIPTDHIWEPCTGSKFSSCCVPTEGDICQPDGLCYWPPNQMAYRGACTDRTFKDPSCNENICVSGRTVPFMMPSPIP